MRQRKVYIELMIVVLGFLSVWMLLSQIDFRAYWSIGQKGQQLEEKIGDLIWKDLSNSYDVIEDSMAIRPLSHILKRLCDSNGLSPENFQLAILDNKEMNALALPGDRLVIFSGMILECQQAEEVAGIMAHEMAHILEGHVMEKIIREIGLSVLIGMTTGGGPESIGQMSKLVLGLAFDRTVEEEADDIGIELMQKAGIDPEPIANLFFRLGSENEASVPVWLSTHPGPLERSVDLARQLREDTTKYIPLMSHEEWQKLKEPFLSNN